MDHIDIDGVLTTACLQPKRSDLRDVILPFPDIWAEQEYMHLQNSRLNSAILPEFQQTTDELTLFSSQCSTTELHQHEEHSAEIPAISTTDDYLAWLETSGLSTVDNMSLRTASDLIQAAGTLLSLADEMDYLRPRNDSHLVMENAIDIARWRVYWLALIAEMRTVKERCSPEIRRSGVFVLTSWPYKQFLRLLATHLLAKASSIIYENR